MKIYHRAKFINDKGEVSALCFKNPHPIDLTKETWTNRDEAVTCEKCLDLIAKRNLSGGLK